MRNAALSLALISLVGLYVLIGFDGRSGYEPHAVCLLGNTWIITQLVAANLAIFVCYMALPISLIALARVVGRITSISIALTVYAVFIIGCGFTHLAEAIGLFAPDYYVQVALDDVTAIASIFTVLIFVPQVRRFSQIARDPHVREALLHVDSPYP